jgi:predicted nucleotidyltransferase
MDAATHSLGSQCQDAYVLDSISLDVDARQLADLCRQYHITKLWFFGSVLRPDFRPDSDVDILVEFEIGKEPGLEFVDLREELARLLGRPVDLLTTTSLRNPFRRSEILRTRRLAYAA